MDMEEVLHRYRNLGDLYAPSKAKREYLEEYKKTLLALLMKDAEKKGVTTVAAQERDARIRPEYLEMLQGLMAALEEEERLRYHLKAVEIEIEMWRTVSANQRVERKAYGA